MKEESPAAVHVDGTARPQILRQEENHEFYAILQEYFKQTGIPTLINTSFNLHEEPIVCTPSDAIRAFIEGNLDYLAMGRYLVKSKSCCNKKPNSVRLTKKKYEQTTSFYNYH